VDKFDRAFGALADLPDVTKAKATTVTVHSPLIGAAQTFIVQTVRQKDVGDTIFLQYVDDAGSVRLAIPPKVAEVIARQRDALGAKVRREIGRKLGKEQAALRKARGEAPAFLKGQRKP
jgi:hypothetical protein